MQNSLLHFVRVIPALLLPLLSGVDDAKADEATSQALENRRAAAASNVYSLAKGFNASSEIDGQSISQALDLPPKQLRATWLTGPSESVARFDKLGVIQPRHGDSLLVLSTGTTNSSQPAPGTDVTGSDTDEIVLSLELEPPAGAAHVSFRFRLLTAEFPAFAAAGYNDRFSATLTDGDGSRVVADFSADDDRVYPVSASRAGGTGFDLFAEDPSQFNTEFGRGLPAAGMSDWITVREPIHGDGPIMLEFRIRDSGDRLVDSAVLLDDVSMSAASIYIAPAEPDFSTAQEDPADVLINCVAPPVPVPVDGAVADGETRLLMEVHTPGPGHVRYTMLGDGAPADGGFIESFDSRERLNEIVVPVVNNHAHARYLVPDNFNRGGDEGIARRFVTARIEYIPDGDFRPFVTFLSPRLKRPGVVFVHGLWSEPGTWRGDFIVRDHPFLTTVKADYRDTNASHFQTNRLMLDTSLAQICNTLREEGLGMRQADVIGHSMGGILGRVYEETRPTLINRLITMNTPHLGSPWANVLLALRDNPDLIVRFVARRIFARMEKPITEGAIDDLAVGSDALNSIPQTPIPSHAMVGVGGKFVTDPIIDGAFANPVLWFLGLRPSEIFDTPEHDLVVGRDSQIGGIRASSTFEDFPGSLHWNVTGNATYSNRILTAGEFSLLNARDIDEFLFDEFPAPASTKVLSQPQNSAVSVMADNPELPLLSILAPENGASVMSGESVTVSVEAPVDFDARRVLLVTRVWSQGLEATPLSGEMTIPLGFVGALELTAFGTDDLGGFAVSEPVELLVAAPAELLGIDIDTSDPTISAFESERQISVSGFYADDVTRDITDPSTGTVYISSDPSVAKISENGLIIPVHEGFTTVIAQNNSFQDSVTVRVLEREPPLPEVVDVSADPDDLWPPDNRMVSVTLEVTSGGQRAAGCQIAEVSANEGNAARDIAITGDLSLELRSSRLGAQQGRIYTIDVECSSGGATSLGTVEVLVPHDQRR